MWTITQIPIEILIFYAGWFSALLFIFYLYLKNVAKSLVMSIGLVIVGSEYWEFPTFAAGFLGLDWWWPYPTFYFVLHHIIVFATFILLLYLTKLKINRLVAPLGIGVICNAFLLLPSNNPTMQINGWIARNIGMIMLSGAFLLDSTLVCS